MPSPSRMSSSTVPPGRASLFFATSTPMRRPPIAPPGWRISRRGRSLEGEAGERERLGVAASGQADEEEGGRGAGEGAEEPSSGLGEQPRRIGARERVEDDRVERGRAGEDLGHLEGLDGARRQAEDEVGEVDAAGSKLGGVGGVLGVEEGGEATVDLGVGEDVVGDGGLARGVPGRRASSRVRAGCRPRR